MVENKNIVIIGASRGIGEYTAKLLAKKGAFVCLISRTEEDLKRIIQEIRLSGGLADYIVADITKMEKMKEVFKRYKSSGKKIDVLINNSGIYKENSDTHQILNKEININLDTVSSIINTNLLGYWWSTLFAKELINENGSIINISSVNGIIGKGNSDIYDLTKAGVNNLTLNLARQLASRKIRVNAICPSSTITPMRDFALGHYLKEKSKEEFDCLEANSIPFKRLGTCEDIAQAILFLASGKSSYLTGQIISIDGGFLLKPTFL